MTMKRVEMDIPEKRVQFAVHVGHQPVERIRDFRRPHPGISAVSHFRRTASYLRPVITGNVSSIPSPQISDSIGTTYVTVHGQCHLLKQISVKN